MLKKSPIIAMLPLLLVLYLDGMGASILYPILNSILVDSNSHFLNYALSDGVRDFLYALILSIFMFSWFFGAAALGSLSDHIGRKKALYICLVGSFCGFLLCASSIALHSLTLLFIGRAISGFTAGSQPIAQAAIIDISDSENKTRNIGFILLAVSIGFVTGPMVGGILSSAKLVSWFNFSTPLYFVALFSLVILLFLHLYFKETFNHLPTDRAKFKNPLSEISIAFQNKDIRFLSIVFIVMIIGWSNYMGFVEMFLIKKYHVSATENSIFMSILSLGFSIGFAYLVDIFDRRFKPFPLMMGSFLFAGLCVALSIILSSKVIVYICAFWIGISVSIGYSRLISSFSDQCSEEKQGWIMGITGSIMALCFGISTFSSGLLVHIGYSYPLIIAAGGLLLSSLLIAFRKNFITSS